MSEEAKLFGKMSQEEQDLIDAKVHPARIMLETASIHMLRYRPFYGALLSSMPLTEAKTWLTAAATDGRNIYFNPEFIAGMSPERMAAVFARVDKINDLPAAAKQNLKNYIVGFYYPKTAREVSFIIEHEIRHVVSEHCYRARGYDSALFNRAADYHNNISLIVEHSVKTEGGSAWFPEGIDTNFLNLKPGEEFYFMRYLYIDKKYDRWITEVIYEDIKEVMQKQDDSKKGQKGNGSGSPTKGDEDQDNQGGGEAQPSDQESPEGQDTPDGAPKGGDTHPDSDGNMEPEDDDRSSGGFSSQDVADALGLDKSDASTVSREQKAANDSIMRRAIESGVKAAGSGAPAEARKFVDEMGSPKINYLRYLRRTLVSLVKENVSYQRLSKRSHSLTFTLRQRGLLPRKQTVALPARMKGNTIDVHAFFDVSGSFTNDLLAPVRRELRGICGMYDEFRLTLAAWSTKVGNVCTYTKGNCRELSDYKISSTGGTDPMCIFRYLDKEGVKVDQLLITDGIFQDLSGHADLVRKYGDKTLWIILGNNHNWKAPFGKFIMFDKYQR